MPKSRVRKKKTKNKKKVTVFKMKDAKITQKGKQLFIQVKRTEEEQRKLIETLKKK